MERPKTPELDKILKCCDKSQVIGEFLEWLESKDEPINLCYFDDCKKEFYPIIQSYDAILEEYFGIDGKKAEQERRDLLEFIRNQHNK